MDGLHAGTRDVAALERRVLATGLLALLAWCAALYVLDALGLGPWYALGAAVVLYIALVRPLMRPVRAAVRMRRQPAHRVWPEAREDDRGPG